MTIWTCLCQGDILLRREGADGALSLPTGNEPPVALQPWNIVTTLQHEWHEQDATVKVVRLDRPVTSSATSPTSSSAASPATSPAPSPNTSVASEAQGALQMIGLRASFDVLDFESYTLAGKAAELIYWDQNTRYCGCCGGEMRYHTEISKRCRECGKEVWPQLATAIIVRVTRIEQLDHSQLDHLAGAQEGASQQLANCKSSNCTISEVLLVHANNFRGDYYGLVAGFVETGETLEECVRREVREETGIEVTNIRYFASQPWPYPCGLMVGFTADYAGGELRLQRSELSNGGWFTRDNLPHIPGRVSLARRLIDDWLEQQ